MKQSLWFVPFLVLVAVMPLGGGLGCSDCQVDGQDPAAYTEGRTEVGYYETSGWNEEWLHFPQGRTYRIEHGLGTDDYIVNVYLSFKPKPFEDDGAAESSGNLGMLEEVNSEYFQVRNDTCAEMYVRAVATRLWKGGGGAGGAE